MNQLELRSRRDQPPDLIPRDEAGALPTIRGRAITFGAWSGPLATWDKNGKPRVFRELIQPGAIELPEDADIKALGDHLPYRVLGRTRSGTLRLYLTREALDVEIDPPDSTIGRDAVVAIERRDVDGMSFGYIPIASTWTEADDGSGELRHTVDKMHLAEVTITAFPAYAHTTLSTRSVEALATQIATWRNQADAAHRARCLALAALDTP